MNLLDLFVVLIIVIALLEGFYRGFLCSVLSLSASFLSWLSAFIFYPALSHAVQGNVNIFNFLLYYTEGAEKIVDFEHTKLLVSQIEPAQLKTIIADANLPVPFGTLIQQNVVTNAFAHQGITTLGDYFNLTIVNVVVNILCFLMIYVIARLVFSFIINALNYTLKFPVLKQFDGVIGGGFGALRGVFTTFVVFIIVPVILVMQPIPQVTEYVNASFLGSFFYRNNFLLNFIRGVI